MHILSIFNTYARTKRMKFRFVQEGDSENLRKTFRKKKKLEATEPNPTKRLRALPEPTRPLPIADGSQLLATMVQQHVGAPTQTVPAPAATAQQAAAPTPPTARQAAAPSPPPSPMPSPGALSREPSRSPPSTGKAKASGKSLVVSKAKGAKPGLIYSNVMPELVEEIKEPPVEVAQAVPEDPRKHVAKVEKAFIAAVQTFSSCQSQALAVSDNLETSSEWQWIKATPHFQEFSRALAAFHGLKSEQLMLKTLLLNNYDLGSVKCLLA